MAKVNVVTFPLLVLKMAPICLLRFTASSLSLVLQLFWFYKDAVNDRVDGDGWREAGCRQAIQIPEAVERTESSGRRGQPLYDRWSPGVEQPETPGARSRSVRFKIQKTLLSRRKLLDLLLANMMMLFSC